MNRPYLCRADGFLTLHVSNGWGRRGAFSAVGVVAAAAFMLMAAAAMAAAVLS
jgi:hypothetical protein